MSADAADTAQTVLFADVVDSTGLYQTFGDDQAQATLQTCMDLMEEIAQGCGGAVRKRIGDEVLCVFPDPEKATTAAGRMHTRIGDGFGTGIFPRAMRLRIGFEHGPVVEEDGELFGSTVHTAARLAALAKAGQILTTLETIELLDPITRSTQRYYDTVQLKGQTGERVIHEMVWSHGATMLSSQVLVKRPAPAGVQSVQLRYGEKTLRLDAANPRLDIGRDEACGLRVSGDAVSRLHARIALDRGKVHVEDVSSNGSGIRPTEGEARDLHRDRVELQGSGTLRLGLHCPDEAAAFIEFRCG